MNRPLQKKENEILRAVLLVGGLGTRLRPVVSSAPKALAKVGDGSFLALLIRQLRHQGIRHLVMCTGYLGEQIEETFGDGRPWDVAIEYSRELSPMGTAGALKLAQPYLQDDAVFLVMNGDSFVEADLPRLIEFHRQHGGPVSMAVVRVENAARYGTVEMEADGRVIGFAEKTGRAVPGMVNAGIYIFDRSVLELIPEGPASLERDVFPRALADGVYALEQKGMFIDIGTPEDYARAQALSDKLYEKAFEKQACPGAEDA